MSQSANQSDRAAQAVNQNRLWQRHVDMAKHGGTPKGGVPPNLAVSCMSFQSRAESIWRLDFVLVMLHRYRTLTWDAPIAGERRIWRRAARLRSRPHEMS